MGKIRGQAVTEYVLLLAVIVSVALVVGRWLRGAGIQEKLLGMMNQTVVHAYQSGHPKAIGPFNEGGPVHHPRAIGDGNFRIFMNPRAVGGGNPP